MRTSQVGVDRRTTGDVGRRVAFRRRQLGLSYEELGARAGVAPGYVEYVERRHVRVSGSALLRLADALQTSVDVLLGTRVDAPPGTSGRIGAGQRLTQLDVAECVRLISPGGVGRIAYAGPDGLEVVPLNFVMIGGEILFRTRPGGVLSRLAGERVAFEVDRIDDAVASGWSVLLRGVLTRVADRALVSRLRNAVRPWAGGSRDSGMRLDADRISGRRVGPERRLGHE